MQIKPKTKEVQTTATLSTCTDPSLKCTRNRFIGPEPFWPLWEELCGCSCRDTCLKELRLRDTWQCVDFYWPLSELSSLSPALFWPRSVPPLKVVSFPFATDLLFMSALLSLFRYRSNQMGWRSSQYKYLERSDVDQCGHLRVVPGLDHCGIYVDFCARIQRLSAHPEPNSGLRKKAFAAHYENVLYLNRPERFLQFLQRIRARQ